MYEIENLPLSINLDQSPYVQTPDIELVDGFAPVRNIIASEISVVFTATNKTKSNAVNCWVNMPAAHSMDRIFQHQAAKAESKAAKVISLLSGWGKLIELTAAHAIESDTASINTQQLSAIGWGELTTYERPESVLIDTASVHINNQSQIIVSDVLQPQTTGLTATHFGVDYFGIRASEYDLRQRDLYTSATASINLDDELYLPSPGIEWGNYQLEKQAAVPLSTDMNAGAYQPPAKIDSIKLPWGEGVSLHYSPELPYVNEPEIIDPGEVPDPNKQEVYIIVNNVNVFALPGNEPLAFAGIKIDLDWESYSWKLSADVLNQQSIDLIKPDANGNKEVAVEINGHRWVFFVPSWSRSRNISGNQLNKRYSITGYSRTQYLGLPYAPKRTRSIGTTTAVQAATKELEGTGFILNWDVAKLSDWVMPNSVFSYQELAALPVIKKLATTAGAIVLPAMNTDELTIQPRYKVAPWDLAGADVDRVIHENQILNEGGVLVSNPKINGLFVSGESEGVGLNVTRLGTAGDQLGADVVESWLSAVEANTSRGRAEIAASGDRINHSLELAIPESDAQPGLLIPGMIVEVQFNEPAKNYRGYVQNNAVSVPGRGLAKCRQSITIEQPISWES